MALRICLLEQVDHMPQGLLWVRDSCVFILKNTSAWLEKSFLYFKSQYTESKCDWEPCCWLCAGSCCSRTGEEGKTCLPFLFICYICLGGCYIKRSGQNRCIVRGAFSRMLFALFDGLQWRQRCQMSSSVLLRRFGSAVCVMHSRFLDPVGIEGCRRKKKKTAAPRAALKDSTITALCSSFCQQEWDEWMRQGR